MSAERRQERAIRDDYMAMLKDTAANLTADNYDIAVELAEVPERIRGYGHVKQAHLERAKEHQESLQKQFRAPVQTATDLEPA